MFNNYKLRKHYYFISWKAILINNNLAIEKKVHWTNNYHEINYSEIWIKYTKYSSIK